MIKNLLVSSYAFLNIWQVSIIDFTLLCEKRILKGVTFLTFHHHIVRNFNPTLNLFKHSEQKNLQNQGKIAAHPKLKKVVRDKFYF